MILNFYSKHHHQKDFYLNFKIKLYQYIISRHFNYLITIKFFIYIFQLIYYSFMIFIIKNSNYFKPIMGNNFLKSLYLSKLNSSNNYLRYLLTFE